MKIEKIQFANGDTLSVGDTFYFVSPALHDGTIETYTVESIWPPAFPYGGERIRFVPQNKSEYWFVFKGFFERESPTCFLDYEKAKEKAQSQMYTKAAE